MGVTAPGAGTAELGEVWSGPVVPLPCVKLRRVRRAEQLATRGQQGSRDMVACHVTKIYGGC